jgi:hypothetical protein
VAGNYFGPPLPYIGGFAPEGNKVPMQRGKPVPPAGGDAAQVWSSPEEAMDKLRDGLLGTFGDIATFVLGRPIGAGVAASRQRSTGEGGAANVLKSAGEQYSAETGRQVTGAKKALGIDPADWQAFIRQTGTDWGIYGGLALLGVLGLVFLVSAAGGGSLRPLSPRSAFRKVAKVAK